MANDLAQRAAGACSGVAALRRDARNARALSGKLHNENAWAFVEHDEGIVTLAVARSQRRSDALFVSQNGLMLGAG